MKERPPAAATGVQPTEPWPEPGEPTPDICLSTQDLTDEFARVEYELAERERDEWQAFEGFTSGQRLTRYWVNEDLEKPTWYWVWRGVNSSLQEGCELYHLSEELDDGSYRDPAVGRNRNRQRVVLVDELPF
jgi:hypothetical protein